MNDDNAKVETILQVQEYHEIVITLILRDNNHIRPMLSFYKKGGDTVLRAIVFESNTKTILENLASIITMAHETGFIHLNKIVTHGFIRHPDDEFERVDWKPFFELARTPTVGNMQ